MSEEPGRDVYTGSVLTAVDDCNGHENTSAASNGTHQIGNNGQETKDGSTKGSCSRDYALKLFVHGALTMTSHNHLLILQLFGNVPRTTSGNLDPGLGEKCACRQSEGDIDEGVDGVEEGRGQCVGGRHVVRNTSYGAKLR